MGCTIPATWITIPRYAKRGALIKNGADTPRAGLVPLGLVSNYLLAHRCQQHAVMYWKNEWSFAAGDVIPTSNANGSYIWAQITEGWTAVDVRILWQTPVGVNNSDVAITSRTGNYTWTNRSAAWAWLTMTGLIVSATGLEQFFIEITPGVGETVKIKALVISEISRTTLV